MLRKGPVPRVLHGLWEYLIGVLLIASPFLFDFDADGATASAVVVGVLLVGLAAASEGPSGLVDQIALAAHAVLDYLVAAALIACPFLFDFADEARPTALFIVLGVAHLVLSIATRYLPARHDKPMAI